MLSSDKEYDEKDIIEDVEMKFEEILPDLANNNGKVFASSIRNSKTRAGLTGGAIMCRCLPNKMRIHLKKGVS